ncbi:MAG: PTS sugar transporter subunit IIA [Alphaproteobacteria bacterium]|nr:PTS sugar transporter subunit IIA [Alphaproteobacteria bacterium]
MIGVVVVTHARLGAEFVAAVEHIVGPQAQMRAIHIAPDGTIDRQREEIAAAVAAVDSGDGVIVLTDMFGGTPSNLAIAAMNRSAIEVIAGVNLPMLVKLAQIRARVGLEEAVRATQDAGRKYIQAASLLLANKERA